MVDSMTDYLRSNFSDPAAVTGRSARTVIFINVNWWYLIFPGAGTLIAFDFVIGTIYQNSRGSHVLPPWKNKVTPALTSQLRFTEDERRDGSSTGHIFMGFRSVHGLEEYAKRVKAQLEPPQSQPSTDASGSDFLE
ncbi:hypothetical protein VTJ04DRAFT_8464 [Mycothermus thermophilus]|uniref:uncharacterized protein n=1 Tax=Humicola insolens TaxID=85995 RepID=UPI0037427842